MDRLNQFMAGNSVPKSLKAQLRQFYRYRHSNVTILESIDIMRTLTPKLQAAVSRYTQAAWLQHTDLFESYEPSPSIFLLYLPLYLSSCIFFRAALQEPPP